VAPESPDPPPDELELLLPPLDELELLPLPPLDELELPLPPLDELEVLLPPLDELELLLPPLDELELLLPPLDELELLLPPLDELELLPPLASGEFALASSSLLLWHPKSGKESAMTKREVLGRVRTNIVMSSFRQYRGPTGAQV
jgi:hypothetical protein